MSEKLRDILDRFEVPAEYFHVEVVFQGAPYTELAFYFANFRDEVECLDETYGRYTYKSGAHSNWVDRIEKLVIDESKALGHHLFFIARLSGHVFMASEELQNAIREKGISGIDFVNPHNWH